MKENSTIFLTGGTGLIGSHFLYFLSDRFKIKALTRNPSRCEKVKELFSYYDPSSTEKRWENIEWIKGDLEDIPFLDEILEDIDYVFHCAGFISFYRKDFNQLLKINFEGTRNLINVCLTKNIKKFLHISSVSTLGKSLDGKPVTELNRWKDSPENSGYGTSKYLGEREVWRGIEEGLPAIILSPSIVLGPGRLNESSSKLFRYIYSESKSFAPGGSAFVGVKDICNAGILLMDSDIQNELFIISSDNLKYNELFQKIAAASNKKAPQYPVKKNIVNIIAFIELIFSVFGRQVKLPKETRRSMFSTSCFDGSKIVLNSDFNYAGIDQDIQDTIKYHKTLSLL